MRRVALRVAIALCCVGAHAGAPAAPRESKPPVETLVPKPSGPLELAYRLDAPPRVGAALEVEVTVRGAALEAPRLEAAAGDSALAIVAQSAPVGIPGGYRWRVTIVPIAAAASYATFVATARIDGVEQSRSVVVPIRTIAEIRGAPEGTAVMIEGERLILLPAEEPATPR